MTPPDTPHELRGLRKFLSRALDLLYPPECALCRRALKDGSALCDGCNGDLPRLAAPFCGKCGEAFQGRIDGDFTCPNCGNLKFSFEFARAALVRDDRTLEMIHRLKYGRELHLAKDLGKLAWEAFQDPRLAEALAGRWPLVPVPLHRGRFRERHFNQAEEISLMLSKHTGLPVVNALRRIRATGHQTILSRAQRLENLRGAFAATRSCRKSLADSPGGAVLVDDVFTTGATVDECAKTLRRAGFAKIAVVTVMRG